MNSFSINLIALQNVLVCGLTSSASKPAAVPPASQPKLVQASAAPVPPVVVAPTAQQPNPPSVAPNQQSAAVQREQEDVKINALWTQMQPNSRKRALVLLQTEQREEIAKRKKLQFERDHPNPDSESSLTTQTFEKTYRLNNFQDYLKIKPRGTGLHVNLGNIGRDYKFSMNVFPNCDKQKDEAECPEDKKNDRLGVYFRHTGPRVLNWKVSLALHSEHGLLFSANTDLREHAPGDSWGFTYLCKHAQVQNVQQLHFKITVATVQEQHDCRMKPVDHAEASTKALKSDLQQLWADTDTADIDINVTEADGSTNTMSVHSWILCLRSPVLKTQIKSWLKPNQRKEINFTGFSYDVVRHFLYYLYTAELFPEDLDPCDDDCKSLLEISDQYFVDSLKKHIGGQLLGKVNRKNCLLYLTLATRHNCNELRDACLSKAGAHIPNLVGTPEWKDLDADTLRDIMTRHFS